MTDILNVEELYRNSVFKHNRENPVPSLSDKDNEVIDVIASIYRQTSDEENKRSYLQTTNDVLFNKFNRDLFDISPKLKDIACEIEVQKKLLEYEAINVRPSEQFIEMNLDEEKAIAFQKLLCEAKLFQLQKYQNKVNDAIGMMNDILRGLGLVGILGERE
jgi:hypothetical protein